MDDRRFDALTRTLAQGSSRRTALKGLFGGLVGGAAVATRLDRAGAQQQCESDSDCATDVCSSWACIEGQCFSFFECEQGQTCCQSTVTCIGANQCCDDSTCNVSDCQVCNTSTHTCESACSGVCCAGVCASECCSAADCDPAFAYDCATPVCNAGFCTSTPDCSENQQCCNYGTPQHYCAQCCSDDDCPGCEVCNAGGVCEQPECCADEDCGRCRMCDSGVCVNEPDCCIEASGTCYPDDPGRPACCDDLLCCPAGNFHYCAGCCSDSDCHAGGTCQNDVCVYPSECRHDRDCPKGACCCDDGDCSSKCCPPPPPPHPHPKPPKPAPDSDGSVTTLPATGSGADVEGSGLLSAAALGAAALFAASKLRTGEPPVETTPES